VSQRQVVPVNMDFFWREHHRQPSFLSGHDSIQIGNLFPQSMSIQEQHGIQRLILSRCSNFLFNGQIRKKTPDIIGGETVWIFPISILLKSPAPSCISLLSV